MANRFIIVFLSMLFSLSFALKCLSQPKVVEANGFKKNSVYGTAGVWFEEIYANVTLNYERTLFEFPASFLQTVSIRSGAGPWVAWLSEGINCFSVISIISGRRSSHLETSMGVLFTYWYGSKEWHPIVRDRYIAGNLGYRYQKPGGSFVFRSGLGWPEGYYLSLGFCF
jgi:hypothetical protein